MEGMELRVPTQKDEADWRRLWTAYLDSVSYTHLTLPTICSV